MAVELIERPAPFTPPRRAAALGLDEAEQRLLAASGLDFGQDKGSLADVDLVLVGHAGQLSEDDWRAVANAADGGATAVVLCPWELIVPGETSAALPLPAPITCTRFHDWLYHKECFARDPGFVAGLQAPGLMKWRLYDQVLPRHLLEGEAEDIAAFAVAVGYPCPGGYASGLLVARFRQGRGRIVVSTFDLLSYLGSRAVAEQLTVSLLRYATR